MEFFIALVIGFLIGWMVFERPAVMSRFWVWLRAKVGMA